MSYFHFTHEERARVSALIREHKVTEYAVLRQLVTKGFERLDAGESLFSSAPVTPIEEVTTRLDRRLTLILERLGQARARDFNMTLELLEHTIWLRTLGEELKPGGQPQVNDRVKKAAQRILRVLHVPPPEAKGAD